MSKIFRSRLALLVCLCAVLAACDVFEGALDDEGAQWEDLGEVPALSSTRLNQTPMVILDDTIIVGTNDGLWQRALAGSDDWDSIGLEGVRIIAVRRHPISADILFAAGQPLDDPTAEPFYRSDDGDETWVASST